MRSLRDNPSFALFAGFTFLRLLLQNALVMIMHRDRQRPLRMLLANAIFIQLTLDLGRFGNANPRLVLPRLRRKFLIEDVLAKYHAIVADVNAGTGNKFLHFRVGFPAEAAKCDVGWTGQRNFRFLIYDFRFKSNARHSFLSAKLVACSTRLGISLRDCTTS